MAATLVVISIALLLIVLIVYRRVRPQLARLEKDDVKQIQGTGTEVTQIAGRGVAHVDMLSRINSSHDLGSSWTSVVDTFFGDSADDTSQAHISTDAQGGIAENISAGPALGALEGGFNIDVGVAQEFQDTVQQSLKGLMNHVQIFISYLQVLPILVMVLSQIR